jgi:transcriptional regulator with XRE-family HTH domain
MINALRPRRHALGLSLQQLADRVGTSKGQIDKLEKGQRRLTIDWLNRLAQALECHPVDLLPGLSAPAVDTMPALLSAELPPPSGISSLPSTNVPASLDGLAAPLMIPLRFSSQTMADAMTQPQRVPAPPQLANSPSAFAFRVPDTSMQPQLMQGDLLYVDPDRPLAPNRLVLIYHEGQFLPRRLLQWHQGQLRLLKLHPLQEETWSLETVALVGSVVGWWSG